MKFGQVWQFFKISSFHATFLLQKFVVLTNGSNSGRPNERTPR